MCAGLWWLFFFFQAEDGIRDVAVTGVQTCALPISGGGSLLSSVPGGALGEPLSATYSVFPSGLALMPRGRFPSGAVAMTACVDASMTVRSPDASFVTYTRTFGGAGGAGPTGAAGGLGASDLRASSPQGPAAS